MAGACRADDVCDGLPLRSLRHLDDAPADAVHLLAMRDPSGRIADRGQDFALYDIVVDTPLPRSRFVLGAKAGRCVVIALEHGGRAHWFAGYELRDDGTGWRVVGEWALPRRPRTQAGLHPPR